MTQLRNWGISIRKTCNIVNQIVGKPPKKSVDECINKNFGVTDYNTLSNNFNNSPKVVQDFSGPVNNTTATAKPQSNVQNSAYPPEMADTGLEDTFNSMSIVKPAGYDQLKQLGIKVNYNNLKHVLRAVINEILETGIIPDNLDVVIVRPIYKKGGKREIGNYRPIALMLSRR